LRSPEPPAGVAIIPLGPRSPSGSSSRPGNVPPAAGRDGRPPSPYLALLRMGFAVPPPLPSGRCALTAPFHPYRPALKRNRKAVSSLWHFPSRCRDRVLPGMLPVRSSDFPPRLPGAIAWPARSREDSSMADADGSRVRCDASLPCSLDCRRSGLALDFSSPGSSRPRSTASIPRRPPFRPVRGVTGFSRRRSGSRNPRERAPSHGSRAPAGRGPDRRSPR
jgi:hypothetical protein